MPNLEFSDLMLLVRYPWFTADCNCGSRYTGLDVICLNEELGYVLVYGKGDFIMGIPSLRI